MRSVQLNRQVQVLTLAHAAHFHERDGESIAGSRWDRWRSSLALAATEGVPRAQQQAPVFRAVREMVLVDVVVRDRNGAVVKGLTANDFEVLEDGRPQQVLQFSYQELKRDATAVASKALLGDVDRGG